MASDDTGKPPKSGDAKTRFVFYPPPKEPVTETRAISDETYERIVKLLRTRPR